MIMKNISILIFFSILFMGCEYNPQQLYERPRDPIAPVLSVEGVTTFVVSEDLSDFFYSALSWSKADFGKGVSAKYQLQVSDEIDFSGNVISVDLATDAPMRVLNATELYGWAVEEFGQYNEETDRNDPATLYFRILAEGISSEETGSPGSVFSNVESISAQWAESEPWEPEELTIRFRVVAGEWEAYSVYAWGDGEVFGGWPGTSIQANEDGWFTIVVPESRPINLILNDNGEGQQFDFLQDPVESLCYDIEIDGENTVWTEVECPEVPVEETAVYMIGEEFGGWDWDSEDVVVMIPVHGYAGHFWAIRYIEAGKGFKWNTKREWNGDFHSLDDVIGYTVSDGNAFVEEDGMYMVYVNLEEGSISVEPARVFGMGDCFGGWDMGAYAFDVEEKTMTHTTTGEGELRIYAESEHFPLGGDWWRMEFVPIDGEIEYRGDGDDQERVQVEAGKKVNLDFNSGTGWLE